MLSDDKANLRSLPDWRPEVTLVPYSGIQILDFGFRLDDVDVKSARFIERVVNDTDSRTERALIPLSGDGDRDEMIERAARDDDDEYSIRPVAALEPFLSNWVPVPVLRLKSERGSGGEERYDPGPTNWARIRTVELPRPDPETGHTHRVQLALDTTLIAANQTENYVAPERDDAAKSKEFRFVSDPEHMDWYLRRLQADATGQAIDLQLWVSEWLQELFIRFKRAERPGRAFSVDNLPHLFEHWARYLAYLKVIDKALSIPKLRMADTVSDLEAVTPVEVDLVLDVGNSRTCGILIERLPDESRIDLARSFPLEIRDLSRAECLYTGLIESRVEFAEMRFGDDRFASRSGRRNAFNWPGFLRVGPEAHRLVSAEEGTETTSGLSSPKRYLWDNTPMQQDWRFHGHHDPNSLPKSIRTAMRHLNEAGDVLEQVAYEEKHRLRARGKTRTSQAIRPRFSRSALFGFMLVELISHALVQINDPAARSRRRQSDLPRRLNRIILTFPTATSAQEQAIIRSRAEGALRLVWAMQGISDGDSVISRRPELIVEWDEASCTQLVYLYSELAQKFDGRIETFLKLKGTPRAKDPGAAPEPSLRLACVDIGGGTTDLMVTTYWNEADRRMIPVQTFREGFRVAGDDLIQRVVAAVVLPRLEQSIREAGGSYVAEKLTELFGGDIGGQDQRTVQKRRQFVLRVMVPLAIELLGYCETADEFESFALRAADVLPLPISPDEDATDADSATSPDDHATLPEPLIDYIERAAADLGAENWRLADLVITASREDIDAISRETFQKILGNMGEVIHHLGVDVLLLTGRPSRLPAVRSIIEELAVLPPHRLVPMHSYKTGRWYPFRDPITQRIGDPKSTVAVGGMLILLAETRLPNFKVSSSAFRMKSTARFIGEMDSSGQITDERVIFSDIDLDQKSTGDALATVDMYAPIQIGSRQLPLERWTTSPLFQLDFANSSAAGRSLPVKVTLERVEFDDGDDDDDEASSETILRREALREAFQVAEVVDGRGDAMKPNDVVLRLHTLGFNDEYWLDTGVFAT
ncbi:MAG: virulence factor SrfB [Pseudomonadota bacterium]